MVRILVIDDEELARFTIREILEAAGHEVSEAVNGNEGIAIQKTKPLDLVITDIIMPNKGGLSTIVELKRTNETLKILAISGGETIDGHDYLGHASDLGADASLTKPFTGEELLISVDTCLSIDTNKALRIKDEPEDTVENFNRFLPKEFLKMLGVKDLTRVELGNHIEKQITVVFSDIRNFTTLSESMQP